MPLRRRVLRFMLMAAFGCALALHPSPAKAQETHGGARKVKEKVTPQYPELARKLNIHGKVKLEAVVGPDGKVKSTKVIGGHPLLVTAAQDAMKQWKFEPGPAESTQIVEFDFSAPSN